MSGSHVAHASTGCARGLRHRHRDRLHRAGFVQLAFGQVGLNWTAHVRHDPRYEGPAEVDALIGNASKAEHRLGWRPSVLVPELAALMVDAEMRAIAGQVAQSSSTPDRSGKFADFLP